MYSLQIFYGYNKNHLITLKTKPYIFITEDMYTSHVTNSDKTFIMGGSLMRQSKRLKELISLLVLCCIFVGYTEKTSIYAYKNNWYASGVTETSENDPEKGFIISGFTGYHKVGLIKVDHWGDTIRTKGWKYDENSDNVPILKTSHFWDVSTLTDGYILAADNKIYKANFNLDITDSINLNASTYSISKTSDGGFLLPTKKGFAKVKADFSLDNTLDGDGFKNMSEGSFFAIEAHNGDYIVCKGDTKQKEMSGDKAKVFRFSPSGTLIETVELSSILGIEAQINYAVETEDGGYAFTGNANERAFFIQTGSSLQNLEVCKLLPQSFSGKDIHFAFGLTERPYGYLLATKGATATTGFDFQNIKLNRSGEILEVINVYGSANDADC